MSVDHLYFKFWMEENDLWTEHRCLNNIIERWRMPSIWKNINNHVEPSVSCIKCGKHTTNPTIEVIN